VAGIFVARQIAMLNRSGKRVDVVYVEPRSWRKFSLPALAENHFQIVASEEDDALTVRLKGWNPMLRTTLGGLAWAMLTKRLVDTYVARFGLPNLIHAHNALWAGYAASGITNKYGIPYVVTEHSSAYGLNMVNRTDANYTRTAFSKADCVMTVSRSQANSIESYLNGKQPVIVPNVVDTDFFTLPPVEPPRRPFVFLAIASLNTNKGVHLLIQAFSMAFRAEADVALEIGGDGPQRCELEALSRQLGVQNQVRFLGQLPPEGVRSALWRTHALVVSSFYETFSVVLIEALATGLPVISTRCGGPADIVTPEVGIFVSPGDVEEMVRALKQMWSNPGFSRQHLRDYAISRYSEPVVAQALHEIYSSILRRRNGPES
jgi:L-malate glycosyltransferase